MTETKNETLYYFISEKRKQALKKIDFWYIVKDTYKNCHKLSENTWNEYRMYLTDNILDFQVFDY